MSFKHRSTVVVLLYFAAAIREDTMTAHRHDHLAVEVAGDATIQNTVLEANSSKVDLGHIVDAEGNLGPNPDPRAGADFVPKNLIALSTSGKCQKLYFFSDIEGAWDFWDAFVKESGAFTDASRAGGNIELKPGQCIVFGGDTLDSAGKSPQEVTLRPIQITQDLVTLYEKYPVRVMLILGNRDINKMRLQEELKDNANPDDFYYYWLADPDKSVEATIDKCASNVGGKWTPKKGADGQKNVCAPPLGPQPSWLAREGVGSKLGKILGESMGAGQALATYTQELSTLEIIKAGDQNQAAEYIRDHLLSPDASPNKTAVMDYHGSWYKYLKYGVMLGGATFQLAGKSKSAVFAHAGVHPLMFSGDQKFRVPAVEYSSKDSTYHYADKGLPLDLTLTKRQRVAKRHDKENHEIIKALGISQWTHHYALWKKNILHSWATDAPWQKWCTKKNTGACRKTGAGRPGVALMDGALGNLAGIFRNAGFTTGGPCVAWEYGINYRGYDSGTYKDDESVKPTQTNMKPEKFAETLQAFGIQYVFNGHFTEGNNKIPTVFQLGDGTGVVVHNHDLSRGGFPLSYSTLSFDGSRDTFYTYPGKTKVQALANPLGQVGTTTTVPETCASSPILPKWPGVSKDRPAAQFLAFIQDELTIDDKKFKIVKINKVTFGCACFAAESSTWYCAVPS